MAKRWYYKDENGNKVPVPLRKGNFLKKKILLNVEELVNSDGTAL